jgi:hypothetical protein
MVDGLGQGGEVEPHQVVHVPDFEPQEEASLLGRPCEVDHSSLARSPLWTADEEESGSREGAQLFPERGLDALREQTFAEDVAVPDPPVLDQEPVVDPARRRLERLAGLGGDVGAEGPTRRPLHRPPGRPRR